MENQRNPFLSLAYFCHGKSMEELRQSLWLTTLELETVRLKAQEELKMRDDELAQLKDMLTKAIKERDEAQDKFQRLFLEKLLLQQLQQQQQLQLQQYQQTDPLSGVSSIEDEPRRVIDSNNGFSSSDSDESIVSSPVIDTIPPPPPPQPPLEQEPEIPLVLEKPLPEKGKLLQAVMKAGPLLQTLLLAGPLPQWIHPPPPLDSYQIPPPPLVIPSPSPPPSHLLPQDSLLTFVSCNSTTINNCGGLNKKRGLYEGSDSSTETKYQRIALH